MRQQSSKIRKNIAGFFFHFCLFFLIAPILASANSEEKAKQIIKNQCSECHRTTGEGKSRFEIKAPDLMWAGVKFKRPWLISFLTGKEDNIYPKNYRWDESTKALKHVVLSEADAELVADYFKKHFMDPRVKKDALDLSHFTELHAAFGRQLFIEHSCTGCHQIMDDGKKMGGPQSASFVGVGKRLNKDWILRFNSNPPDFVPHSGEFVADVSELGLHYISGFIATEGDDSFKFYEPWKSEYFKNASTSRGKTIYKEYCSQCHGPDGKGDGPAASGLNPKPAVHAQTALDQYPLDYLYNIVYYGGKAVGKSHYMPYWGLTLKSQGVADVIAYMRETFKGGEKVVAAAGTKNSGDCPQNRNTKAVSSEYMSKQNPLQATPANLKAGETLFHKTAKPMTCELCHGKRGDGKGPAGSGSNPAPRNFTCSETMKDISDGQMFGIIKTGSPGTIMPAFKNLKDEEAWQLIHYIRSFSN